MPQSLTALEDFNDSPTALLQRPHLAAKIVAIACRATRIENALARLFLRLLDGDQEAALAIYLKFNEAGPRKTVFDAVAGVKLTPENNKEYEDLADRVRSKIRVNRNKFIHRWWAHRRIISTL
jgi:hypothetical protein